MKLKLTSLAGVLTLGAIALTASCNKHDDHAGHDHEKDGYHSHEKTEKSAEHGHDHDASQCGVELGPNGGRLIKTDFSPAAEFFITDAGKVSINFYNDKQEAVDGAVDSVRLLVDGEEQALTKTGNSYQSVSIANKFPAKVMLRIVKGDDKKNTPFEVDLANCTDCKNKKYSCTCHNHDHADHDDHDHGDHSGHKH